MKHPAPTSSPRRPVARAAASSAAPQPAPEAQTQQPPAQPQFPEPAPTDLRRNVWLLIIILGVVVVAWAFSLLSKPARPLRRPAGERRPARSRRTARSRRPARGPARPAAPAGAARRHCAPSARPALLRRRRLRQAEAAAPAAEAVMPMGVIGSDRLLPRGLPRAQRTGQDGASIRMPLLFDVTQRAKAFDPRELIHMPGRWAVQRPTLAAGGQG